MYRVDETLCSGCGTCVDICPMQAIAVKNGKAWIDQDMCVECGHCADVCPQNAISAVELPVPTRAAEEQEIVASGKPLPAEMIVQRPAVEVLPQAALASRALAFVGSAVVWMARNLLPVAAIAWKESRLQAANPPVSRRQAPLSSAAVSQRGGHRHRWGSRR